MSPSILLIRVTLLNKNQPLININNNNNYGDLANPLILALHGERYLQPVHQKV